MESKCFKCDELPVAQCECGLGCNHHFCVDHGSVGGDREGDEGSPPVAVPSACALHGGFDADAGLEADFASAMYNSDDFGDQGGIGSEPR